MGAEFRVVSLFSGCGGFDLGFQQAGYQIIWANDVDPSSCASHRHNLGGEVVCGDIGKVDWSQIPDCDVLIGGPPCQGFSVAGKMTEGDPRNDLIDTFCAIVGAKRPQLFVMENVKALYTVPKWKWRRDRLFFQFMNHGYRVDMGVLNAKDYGVPQNRERAFFIGSRMGYETPLLPWSQQTNISVRSALAGLGEPGAPGNDITCSAEITPYKTPVLRPSPYAGMLLIGGGRVVDLERPSPTIPATAGGNRTPIIDQRAYIEGAAPWVVGYHAHLMAGGAPVDKVPEYLRRMTAQECARIQTFPDDFVFVGGKSSVFRQIGNAVPVVLARAIAEHLRGVVIRKPLPKPQGLDSPEPGTVLDLFGYH